MSVWSSFEVWTAPHPGKTHITENGYTLCNARPYILAAGEGWNYNGKAMYDERLQEGWVFVDEDEKCKTCEREWGKA